MIIQDIFEPVQVKALMEQSIAVNVIPLNEQGYADYMWTSYDGHRIQVERKQIDEILSGLNHVEEQLQREIIKAEETILLYEGTFEPIQGLRPCCQSWRRSKTGNVMVPSRKYDLSYSMVQSWFYQLDKCGITIMHTSDYIGTAIALVSWHNSSQVQEHTTLRRYIKEHITPEPRNPHIHNLMALKGAEIGQVKAEALIAKYGTFWYCINQPLESLAETIIGQRKDGAIMRFGDMAARKLLKSVGRI